MLKEEKEGSFVQIDIQMLLDSFETPAIFYRENTVRYFNQWAKHLFPSITSGKGLPEEFDRPRSPFVPEVHQMQRGTLYLLRPRQNDTAGNDLAQVTRELRACLTALTAATEQLWSHLPEPVSPDAQHLLQVTNHNLYRLRRLADHSDLLRQMEEGDAFIYREAPLDLAGLCRDLGGHIGQLAQRSGVPFYLDCSEASLPTLGDAALLQRMLLNLISNALRAAGASGEVGLRLEKKGDRAHVTIWDTGTGMETEQLMSVFRPQPRRHRLPRPDEGVAMGLRLVREIAVLHQGLVLAESRPGGGVTMTISLPIRKPDPNTMRSEPAWGDDGFQLVLTELADVLPAAIYAQEDLEG